MTTTYARRFSGTDVKWIALAGAMTLLVSLIWCWGKGEPLAPKTTFTTLAGETVSMQSLQGKMVLVNFWATSCVTCVREMPALVALYEKYRAQGYETIAVAMSYDRPDYVLNFATTRRLPFRVALDVQGLAAKQFGDIKLTPTSFLIDKQGRIIRRYVGVPDFVQMEALIQKELG